MHSSSHLVFLCRLDPAQFKNSGPFLRLIGDNTGVILHFFLITITDDWIPKLRDPKSVFQVLWHLSSVKYFISLQGSGASAAIGARC